MTKAANFADRLSDLIKEDGKSLRQIAKECEMSYSSLSKYQNDMQTPDAKAIERIADYFNVTTDYLLCQSDIRKPDITIQAINEQTGLSERAIMILQRSATHNLTGIPFDIAAQPLPPDGSAILSSIIESPIFSVLIQRIHDLLSLTQQSADGIVNEDTRQQIAEWLEDKPKQSIGIQSKQDLIDIKEFQISHSFMNMIKALEQEANSNVD